MTFDKTFALDPRLAADTLHLGTLSLCRVTLRNDARFPWLILVPQRNAIEILDLEERDRHLLMEEMAQAGQALRQIYKPDKLNVAALGNIVPQLHVHVVARFRNDAAWPRPVWGQGEPVAYAEDEREKALREIREALDF